MSRLPIPCLFLFAFALTGCPASGTSTEGSSGEKTSTSAPAAATQAGGAASPEEAFEKLKASANAHDYPAFFLLLTRDSQDKMLTGQLVGAAITLAPIGTKPNPDKKQELDAIFAKHGLDATPAASGPAAGAKLMAEMSSRLEKVKDRAGLFDDLMKYLEKNGLSMQRETVLSMEGLKVVADKGTASVLVKGTSGQTEKRPIELHKVNGRWYVHISEWK